MKETDVPFPEAEEAVQSVQEKLDLTKTNILNAAHKRAGLIIDGGNVNPLEAYIRAKAMLEYCKGFILKMSEAATEEANKYDKKEGKKLLGVSFAIASTGKKYDFSKDSEWTNLQESLEQIKEEVKSREEFLKTLKKEMAEVDGGDVIYPAQLISAGKDTLKITFDK
jgi:hypothetical protein